MHFECRIFLYKLLYLKSNNRLMLLSTFSKVTSATPQLIS